MAIMESGTVGEVHCVTPSWRNLKKMQDKAKENQDNSQFLCDTPSSATTVNTCDEEPFF